MAAREQDYRVELSVFDGPLDVLVHLVKKNKIDIADIPIHVIVAQYMEYLALAKAANLQLATSFFEMAATLLAIKAAMLLPRIEGEDEEDPREDLAEQIRVHEQVVRIKEEIVRQLAAQENFLERSPTVLRSTQIKGDISRLRLEAIWQRLQESQTAEEHVHTVTIEPVSAVQVQAQLHARLRKGRVDVLAYLFSLPHRLYQITAFLVILEGVRQQQISLYGDGAVWYMEGNDDDSDHG